MAQKIPDNKSKPRAVRRQNQSIPTGSQWQWIIWRGKGKPRPIVFVGGIVFESGKPHNLARPKIVEGSSSRRRGGVSARKRAQDDAMKRQGSEISANPSLDAWLG